MLELRPRPFSDSELEELQRLTFDYFLKETNPENGLVPDSTRQGSPCSIAPTGFALAAYPVGVERGFITRDDAIRLTLTSLRLFANSPHGPEPDATGYKGFYYHFLDMKTGRRVFNSELSTIESTYVIAGALTAAELAPKVTTGSGLPFGGVFWLVVDEGAVPLLGLSKGPTAYPLSTHAYALSSHFVYGLTAEVVRRAVRKAM
jgi:hypothetical protein